MLFYSLLMVEHYSIPSWNPEGTTELLQEKLNSIKGTWMSQN